VARRKARNSVGSLRVLVLVPDSRHHPRMVVRLPRMVVRLRALLFGGYLFGGDLGLAKWSRGEVTPLSARKAGAPDRESAMRWCSTCESWSTHEARYEGNVATREEHEVVYCSRCGTVAERRKLDPVELPE